MARKTIVNVTAEMALSDDTLFELFRHLEIRCSSGNVPVAFVCPFGSEKDKAPIVIYDHRMRVAMAAYRFEYSPTGNHAQLMVEEFIKPARVRVITSRIQGVDRLAVNLYPPNGEPSAFFIGSVENGRGKNRATDSDANDPVPCLWEWWGKIPGRNVVSRLKICPVI